MKEIKRYLSGIDPEMEPSTTDEPKSEITHKVGVSKTAITSLILALCNVVFQILEYFNVI